HDHDHSEAEAQAEAQEEAQAQEEAEARSRGWPQGRRPRRHEGQAELHRLGGVSSRGLALGAVGALLAFPAGAAARPTPKPQVPRSVLVAYARSPEVAVFNAPTGGAPRLTLTNPMPDGTMLSFLVRSIRPS